MYVITSPIARRRPARYLPARRRVPLPVLLVRRRGLAGPLPQDQQQIAGIAAAGATATASILVALGTVGGPVGAAVAGLVALGVGIANLFGGCGQSCVVATQIDNRFGDLLAQNFNTYMASPVHYRSLQLAALNNFDTLWNGFQQMCSNAGVLQKCVADRQAGACHYRSPAGAWVSDGSGGWKFDGAVGPPCWNWFTGMRDPIANDPAVVPDPSPVSSVSAAAGSAGSSLLSWAGLSPSSAVGGFQVSDLVLPAVLLLAAAVV